jgi:Arc/MetJ family transcription regulator
MRTNIEIDDRLMRAAMRSSGRRTKRATVDEALRLLVQIKAQRGIRQLRGKIRLRGNSEESRRS